jgi:hypothetical protein
VPALVPRWSHPTREHALPIDAALRYDSNRIPKKIDAFHGPATKASGHSTTETTP